MHTSENTGNRTVTLVDDNAILRVIFSNMIKNFPDFPITVNLFENALDALDYFENKRKTGLSFTDLLFVDINMPFMTGWEMMDRFEMYPVDFLNQMDIYILSSSTSKTDQELILQYPFINGYLPKPIMKSDLYDIIRQLNCPPCTSDNSNFL
ncbi:response regulator [Sphingobacterium sp. ML3W]|uniref:response regulator n=1 Tax=Sphingobacterium sp. ML3W TaxID=1538644 RepID=UPI000690751F|nr:response regulator [Sphingobacterium sp. ML3W]